MQKQPSSPTRGAGATITNQFSSTNGSSGGSGGMTTAGSGGFGATNAGDKFTYVPWTILKGDFSIDRFSSLLESRRGLPMTKTTSGRHQQLGGGNNSFLNTTTLGSTVSTTNTLARTSTMNAASGTFAAGRTYADAYEWDRGGKSKVPYHGAESVIPPPRHAYPTLLADTDLSEPANTFHSPLSHYHAIKLALQPDPNSTSHATRLPLLPRETLKKTLSCVDLAFQDSVFTGKFAQRDRYVKEPKLEFTLLDGGGPTPGGAGGKRRKLAGGEVATSAFGKTVSGTCSGAPSFVAASEDLGEKAVDASKKLWREASTGDMYWAVSAGKKKKNDTSSEKKKWDPNTDEVPGLAAALREGGSINWRNPDADGMSLFALKCYSNERKMTEYLYLNFGPDLTTTDFKSRNLFHHVARVNAVETCTFLLRKLEKTAAGALGLQQSSANGGNNATNAAHASSTGGSPRRGGNRETALHVLLRQKDCDGHTPLHLAALEGSKVVAELFLKAVDTDRDKANVNALLNLRNWKGQTALDLCNETLSGNVKPHLQVLLDPLSYLQDPNSLSNRMKGRLNGGSKEEDEQEDENDEDEEEPEEEAGGDDDEEGREEGGGGAVKSKFKNIVSMDRACNIARFTELKNAKKKGKKGGKKKKKK
eukprot:CAMPEP_0179003240 /NCGR_PEP_ID=MMETSP0795-20121207/12547_1 /TAXON_ID=88552 /ORGANISM="Amoebophrya sp., Strain Ameob2" /LENGTH=647 /DNA_ID=CAMNT_0020697185 /DNA_START=1 /DNA_END=1945 /DNA_ORIENTATION=+